jgi:hypothetical protein
MRDFSTDDMQNVHWTELQSKAESAAFALGLGVAEAGRFGAAAARHLSADRAVKDLTALLDVPEEIARYSRILDDAIENSVLAPAEGALIDAEASALISFFEALPCAVDIEATRDGLRVQIGLKEASKLSRGEMLSVPADLMNTLKRIAKGGARRSTQGARLMEL